ncbi:MAG TPA: hypothetical protein VGL25_09080 [Casimicrobiaceae bacterium]
MASTRKTTRTLFRRALVMPIACFLAFDVATMGDAFAHGFVGKRFFPATLVTEDPFVADELSLPTISYRKVPGEDDGPSVRQSDFSIDMSKRITENFGIGFGATYKQIKPDGGDTQRGFDNLGASVKYKFYQSNEHEAILSAGVDWDIGSSGSKRVGAESFSTFTPALFFGKGFGDLSDDMKYLRPFAVTGQLGIGIPSRASTTTVNDEGDVEVERNPHTLQWGFAIEYSVPYLNANVQGTGWSEPFNQLIPVVEFSFSTALDRGAHGTTGTINPGIIWAGRYVQVAAEAVIPVNSRSGSRVGWIAQLHFFLDDLFPTTIGKPIF